MIMFIILFLFVILFSIQNTYVVNISFIFWSFEASLAIVIFLSVVVGIIIGFLFSIWLKSKKNDEKQVKTEN
ncbi:lipopolysaccharide assembly protein LapA domain-containing protein [Thermodesulfovibrio hydrogeniphilus]